MIAAALLALAATGAAPVVSTAAGPVRGEREADGRLVFRGIPFAAPPVGRLRWRPPARVPHWRAVRDATRSAPACPQIDYGWNHRAAADQSEDCLYLEVGTPALKPAKPLPVMVWIHGGGNRGGSGAGTVESPLVRRGIVLVSIQYRLNALGFLSHPALSREGGGRSGNYALMDQQAALRWVKRNIARFGGDPANITLFGESAGAQDVGLQMLAPGARGLFDKAIEQSGTPGFGIPPRTLAENERLGVLLAAKAGAPADASAAQLRALPAEALVAASESVDVPDLDDDSFIWLAAVVDGAVLTETPAETLARGGGQRVPLLIGSNARELSLYGGNAGAERAIARGFGAEAAAARAFYGVGPGRTPVDDARLGDLGTQLSDDLNFRCPADRVAAARARAGVPVWQYHFDYRVAGKPVAHGSEIALVLGEGAAGAPPLARYWVNFARTGDPNGPGLPHWPRHDATRAYMAFGQEGASAAHGLRASICDLRGNVP